MPGLIPLLLQPAAAGNRTSVIFPSSPKTRARNSLFIPSAMPAPLKPRPAKRLSAPAPAQLPVLPYTAADWRRTIAEVKRQHVSRRYRACFTRCAEILDNVKETSDVEPAYLIYLHFYAATSMEACARPLIEASPYRAQLLEQARTHYDRAAELIQTAEESVTARTRPSSATSTTSSLHSPAESVSSRAWTSETGLSTPTPSVCSLEDFASHFEPAPPSPAASSPSTVARKKVSFSLSKEEEKATTVLINPQFYIRPDSPTLGFDDEYFTSALGRPGLPEPPSKRPRTPEAGTGEDDDDVTPRAVPLTPNPFDDEQHADHLGDSYMLAGSVSRYCEHLAALKSQLSAHRSDLDTLLLEGPPFSSSSSSSADDVDGDSTARRRLRGASIPAVSDEMRTLDRKVRIERLRKSGWQRKRFDPRRYEELRSAVLAELDG